MGKSKSKHKAAGIEVELLQSEGLGAQAGGKAAPGKAAPGKAAGKKEVTRSDSETGAGEGETLEEAIAKLSPEQAEMFMKVLSLTMKKRRIMLIGNLLALLLLLSGMLWAFVAFANREPGSFSAWVFLVPFGSAGLSLWIFGKYASQAGTKTTAALDEGRQAQASKSV